MSDAPSPMPDGQLQPSPWIQGLERRFKTIDDLSNQFNSNANDIASLRNEQANPTSPVSKTRRFLSILGGIAEAAHTKDPLAGVQTARQIAHPEVMTDEYKIKGKTEQNASLMDQLKAKQEELSAYRAYGPQYEKTTMVDPHDPNHLVEGLIDKNAPVRGETPQPQAIPGSHVPSDKPQELPGSVLGAELLKDPGVDPADAQKIDATKYYRRSVSPITGHYTNYYVDQTRPQNIIEQWEISKDNPNKGILHFVDKTTSQDVTQPRTDLALPNSLKGVTTTEGERVNVIKNADGSETVVKVPVSTTTTRGNGPAAAGAPAPVAAPASKPAPAPQGGGGGAAAAPAPAPQVPTSGGTRFGPGVKPIIQTSSNAPPMEDAIKQMSSGRKYLDASEFSGEEKKFLTAQANEQGIPVVDKGEGDALANIDNVKSNLSSMMAIIDAPGASKLPGGPISRAIFRGPLNKLEASTQYDPDLASANNFREIALNSIRALGAQGRLNAPELQMAVSNIPEINDTAATARDKVRNLTTLLENKEKSVLIKRRFNGGAQPAPGASAPQPSNAGGPARIRIN